MSKSFLRNVIGEYMPVLGEKDGKVVVVNADLSGTCRNRSFVERFPERSFNVGIAEQNMVSFAAGLAYEGFMPFIFSAAPFLAMRACEQIRTDIAYGNRNVRMIGVYAGVSGGISGATHWAIEDVGIMTSMPGVAVFEVSDPWEAKKILDSSLEYEGPLYIRCTVEPTEDIYGENEQFTFGGSKVVCEGNDGAILCSGVMVQYALQAAERLKTETGKQISVVDMYSIKPIDRRAVIDAAKTGSVLVVQDHNIIGGLGNIVGSVLAEESANPRFRILGITDRYVPMAHAGFLYQKFGIDPGGISSAMKKLLGV